MRRARIVVVVRGPHIEADVVVSDGEGVDSLWVSPVQLNGVTSDVVYTRHAWLEGQVRLKLLLL